MSSREHCKRVTLRSLSLTALGALLAIAIAPAHAAADSPIVSPPPIGPDPLEFTFRPGLWLPRLGGDVLLGPSPAAGRLDVDTDLNLRDNEATFLGEFLIRKADYWELQFSGFSFSTSSSATAPRAMQFGGTALAAGQMFQNTFDMTSFAGEFRFGMFQPLPGLSELSDTNRTSCGRRRVDLRFSPLAGARYINVKQRLTTGATAEEARGEWLAPYIGLNFELTYRPDGCWPLTDSLVIEVAGAAGPALGGDGGFVWQIQAGLTWHATRHFGVTFGYRLVELDVEKGDYQMKAGLQGLLIAGSVRF